ncbi:hypothetical protein LCGC14_2487790 [marine sediment metagenome]|uniref:Uncharacterized protein n=1 Tax=marine sediment metagenome TaxID=412755 RepID=A0A0F9BTM4_9ZZZZ
MNLSVVLNISSILLGIIGLSLYFIGKFEQNQRYNKTMRLLLDISTEVDRNEEKPGINMKNEKNSYSILKSRIMPLSDPLRKASIVLSKAFLCDGGSSSIFSILRMSLKLGLV